MSVGTFDPNALTDTLDEDALNDLRHEACGFLADELTLTDQQVIDFTPFAVQKFWVSRVQDLSTDELKGLIRIFTLGEMCYPGWQAGDQSPVILFVKTLKSRQAYDSLVTRWIKSHSTNKFLPHGNLLDRL
ncbi:MAG: hypothetical protein HN856_07985 [Gammaproteobacteria bacterium]|jgi:hypothetical protein|nr:hypothetical protein [Gammaproteobacteria bacterium]MCH1550928.1 hypothetical protein [Pseudomonadales bacterium]